VEKMSEETRETENYPKFEIYMKKPKISGEAEEFLKISMQGQSPEESLSNYPSCSPGCIPVEAVGRQLLGMQAREEERGILGMFAIGRIIHAGMNIIIAFITFAIIAVFIFGWIGYGSFDGMMRFFGFTFLFFLVSWLFALPFVGILVFVLELLGIVGIITVSGMPLSFYNTILNFVGLNPTGVSALYFWVVSLGMLFIGIGITAQQLQKLRKK
jgi:hypothetical protein